MGVKKSGFTLIEMLVVVTLLSTVGLMAVSIFFSTLRGGTKAELLKEVKQNGNYTISVMERMIRNARFITSSCDGTPQASIKIVNPDLRETVFSCDGQIASNSAFLTTDKLVVSDCSFTCQEQSRGQKVVAIKFTLSQRGSPARPEERASVTFETTVSPRSY